MTLQGAFGAAFEAARERASRFGARAQRRVQHALWAMLGGLLLIATSFLDPVDQFIWLVQSRIVETQASGDVIFVGVDEDIYGPSGATTRGELARALRRLEAEGASQVFLDLPSGDGQDLGQDQDFKDALAELGPRLVLVDRLSLGLGGTLERTQTLPGYDAGRERVIQGHLPNYLDLTWTEQFRRSVEGTEYRTFAAAMAGDFSEREGSFQIDYAIRSQSIPSLSLTDLDDKELARPLAGHVVVISRNATSTSEATRVPGENAVPISYTSIYAAETLKSGRGRYLGVSIMWPLFAAALLVIAARIDATRRRWIAYAMLVATVPMAVVGGAAVGVRMQLADICALLVLYSILAARARWQERAALFDPETGLPTLRALEDWAVRNKVASGHIVVARIHGYEHVLRTLHSGAHADYAIKLADRLRAADKDLSVFASGHYFAWHDETDEAETLVEHLTGLRAIFAAPVQVADHTVDVGITFGLARLDGNPASRIAAAIASVEETNEATDPVRVATSGSEMDLLWDISLRARIDDAMEAGEIYCVYQPKIDIVAQQMIGVEALVRWHDPAKGFIPPMHFIQQCEKAGRMEHLTRYVLQSACSAGKLLHFRGQMISMAVNISATLLVDMRIAGIVRNVLQATGFDPRFLILEVTETARITHFEVAATVLGELKSIGCRISMDDFGVGAANFETFYELPFDEIKLDRLFVGNAVANPKAQAIVASVIAMGNSARITVVAEGAESEKELELLERFGCRAVQGFALSRPLSLSNLLEFKTERREVGLRNMV